MRPLLLLDVDGVLNPYPETPAGYSEYAFFPEDDEPVRLCASHAGWIEELSRAFEVVWATGWGETANELICPAFGLPPFPFVVFPPIPFEPSEKLTAIAAFVGARPAAWVEDIVTDEARSWAGSRAEPTLIVEVKPAQGLTRKAVDELLGWAGALPSAGL